MGTRQDIYERITGIVIEKLEQGTAPWSKPWTGGAAGAPMNFLSKKPYRGINVFVLSMQGYSSPYWITFKQAKSKGGSVRKGEKATPVVFWKWIEKEEEKADGTKKIGRIPFARYYNVFNVEQTEGLDLPTIKNAPPEFDPIEAAEEIAAGYDDGPSIEHKGGRAFYVPAQDAITMPKRELFKGAEEYYSTLFHEMTHSTGHESRLKRSTLTDLCPFGSSNYSREELVAEMGAAMLCGVAGIENKTVDNSAAYLASWLKALKNDKRLVVTAAAQAQKAADRILGTKFD